MGTPKFSLAYKDRQTQALVEQSDHRTLALWARDCAERVLPYFRADFPEDPRPQQAIDTLQTWIDTGEFSMTVIRKASLSSHAAAREVGEDTPARSAARAAGQAVATAHVPTHAVGAANYALQAFHRAAAPDAAAEAVAREREWQYRRLLELSESRDAVSL